MCVDSSDCCMFLEVKYPYNHIHIDRLVKHSQSQFFFSDNNENMHVLYEITLEKIIKCHKNIVVWSNILFCNNIIHFDQNMYKLQK